MIHEEIDDVVVKPSWIQQEIVIYVALDGFVHPFGCNLSQEVARLRLSSLLHVISKGTYQVLLLLVDGERSRAYFAIRAHDVLPVLSFFDLRHCVG